ncbi:MAG: alpha-1,2-fucosyltransferase [Paracoccaceae bacterium]
MIITRLHGRLGNQMFQYAAARGAAARLGVPVALDVREAEARGEGVLTRVFDLPVETADNLPPPRSSRVAYAAWRTLGQPPRLLRERGLGYNAAIEHVTDPAYLHGYWQCERYFAHVADQIRGDFTFPAFSTPQNRSMADRIAATPSIALHVRRGDYLSLGQHTVCDEAYYLNALDQIRESVADPVVYVFSDDPDWAKANLPLPCEKVVVDFNGPETDFEDMRLMSLCQHNIIGNSSFSWWAAWLNQTPGQRVAGPARWFGDPKMQNPDILPEGWLRIPV